MDQGIKNTIEKLTPQQTQEALKRLDHPTLQAAAGIAAQIGFQHMNLSRDTRLELQARKAHRFVAVNCEDVTRRILGLTGAEPSEIEDMLRGIAAQVHGFMEARRKEASEHAAKLKPAGENLQ